LQGSQKHYDPNFGEDDPNTLYFHVVAHSHDDVGWQSTPEEYFNTSVNQILSSVVEALLKDPLRRFSQCEIYYFEKWWQLQN